MKRQIMNQISYAFRNRLGLKSFLGNFFVLSVVCIILFFSAFAGKRPTGLFSNTPNYKFIIDLPYNTQSHSRIVKSEVISICVDRSNKVFVGDLTLKPVTNLDNIGPILDEIRQRTGRSRPVLLVDREARMSGVKTLIRSLQAAGYSEIIFQVES